MSRAIVLLSGGQDSTTCLYWARTMFDEVCAVTIDYGQRNKEEIWAAQRIAHMADVEKHIILPLEALSVIGNSALVDKSQDISASGGTYDEEVDDSLPTSFVPGRNLLFLGLVGAVAAREECKHIVTGVCETDYSGYPDCRYCFIESMEKTLNLAMPSSACPIRIHVPLMWLSKVETVHLAERLTGCWEALAISITCYHGKTPGCGDCPSCILRAEGFLRAGCKDPAIP